MSAIIGLLACAVASLFFGTMFVPVRKYASGDGNLKKIFINYKCIRTFRTMGNELSYIGGRNHSQHVCF